jgi:ParB family chromosome partitioning protein
MTTTDDPQTRRTTTRRTLGKGLGALLGEAAEDYAQVDAVRSPKTVPVEMLHPGPLQPRRQFDASALADLAQSIRERGILQAILVRRHPNKPSEYQIIAGERRWRAAQQAGLHEVPITIRDFSDVEALEVAIVENVQREDLSAIEEAEGYQRLIADYGHSQDDLARTVGKSRAHISNTMRLLKLPDNIRSKIDAGEISAGHARALLASGNPEELLEKILAEGLSVRGAEEAARQSAAAIGKKPKGGRIKDPNTAALERELSATLGLRVTIAGKAQKGTLMIHYQTLDQLDDVLKRLCGTVVRA